ncbi:hypothetical protein FOA52_000640 [Chlamydomonas sp. UWO 241]|nr:hypothetical protein FOA52_000640 [Chlamydomonas sp. UWO 241]
MAALLVAHPRNASVALQAAGDHGTGWRKAFVDAVACAARDDVPRAWHEVVKVEAFAPEVAVIVADDASMATLKDADGVTAMNVATGGCRQAMIKASAFLGRYQIDRAVHTSETCTVLLGRDLQLLAGDPAATVALKLMHDEEAFLSEVLPRMQLDTRYVVGVLRVHIAPSETDSGGSAAKELLQTCEGVEGDVHDIFGSAHAQYRLCVVMPCGDCSLQDAMLHEHFAGIDWHLIKNVGEGVLRALSHMHVRGLVHGDMKPLNVMRVVARGTARSAAGAAVAAAAGAGSIWRLIDLDVTREIGQTFGDTAPSSGYCAPELAKAMLVASAGARRGGGAQPLGAAGRAAAIGVLLCSALSSVRASIACDLWSFGVMLFYLGAARPLLPTDLNDNLSANDLAKLANWERRDLNKRLIQEGLPSRNDVLVDLLTKLLEANPVERLAHWAQHWEGVEVEGVLHHPFFNASTRMDQVDLGRRMDAILHGQERLEEKVDRLQAQMRMLSSLFSGDREVPSLLCFVPVDASGLSWWRSADPSQWLQKLEEVGQPEPVAAKEVLLYFVDPISMEFDMSSGFPLKFSKEWVKKAMPYVKVRLTALKIASAAGRLAGFPIPDFAGSLQQMLVDQVEAMKQVSDAVGGDQLGEWVDNAMGAVDRAIDGAIGGTGELSDAVRAEAAKTLSLSCAEVKKLLDRQHPCWKDGISLKRVKCIHDCTAEWVLPKHRAAFEKDGSVLLAKGVIGRSAQAVAPVPSPRQENEPPQPGCFDHLLRPRPRRVEPDPSP